jgi:hypothetical protein
MFWCFPTNKSCIKLNLKHVKNITNRIHEFPAFCCLLAKGGSLIFVHDFKGGPLIIKPYSRGGPRKNKLVPNRAS